MPECVASNSSKRIRSSATPALNRAARKADAPTSRLKSSLVPASIQMPRSPRRAAAYRGTIRTGSQSSHRCHTSGRSTPVTGSNGSRGVPSSPAEKHAATPSSPSRDVSSGSVNDTRDRKSSHHRKMSPLYLRRCRTAAGNSGM
jgi:hypothetical protein